ncbi:hypothetical protein [Brevibacillus gelatini]|nr:hypothetical protein [Brevibacillus gelatini]
MIGNKTKGVAVYGVSSSAPSGNQKLLAALSVFLFPFKADVARLLLD